MGKTGLRVSEMSLGTWGLSGDGYGAVDDATQDRVLRRAVDMVAGRAITEASGRITRETAPAIAAAGVDLISSGWITHSAPILDLGLDIAD